MSFSSTLLAFTLVRFGLVACSAGCLYEEKEASGRPNERLDRMAGQPVGQLQRGQV